MWLINFLPEWIFYVCCLAGIIGIAASFLLGMIPFVGTYKLIIQIFSIILLVFGSFMLGQSLMNKEWKLEAAKLQQTIDNLAIQAEKKNVQIVTEYVVKKQIVHDKANEVIKYVDKEIVKYDNQCKIPQEFIKALNDATGVAK